MKLFRKQALCLLLVLLLAAAALTGCMQTEPASTEAPKTEAPKTEAQTQAAPATTAAPADTEAAPAVTGKPEELGEGAVVFYLDVTDRDNVTSSYAVHTDADTVGAALTNLDLISGENGLYDTVCGKTLDWNTDHMYWAFYIDGAFASTGLDETPIAPEGHYALTATAG